MKYLFLGVFLLIFTFFFYLGLKKDPTVIPSNLIEKEIPDFNLEKTNFFPFFERSNLLENKDIKIINFFASWCPPCKVEHPNLIKLSKKFEIYGIAKKDNDITIHKWLKKSGNPFVAIGLDNDGSASINWGVYGLPETFVVSGDGKIIYKHVGPITINDLNKINEILKIQ
ncbi:MAG: DsbE family thiol:disulfide interchange protein [Alphaproteobacteria bacterium]|nr:DsbE family thiol:disulfide interchange protein [Alphaproteobacteria bacterium]